MKFTIQIDGPVQDKVAIIKSIRTLTGLSLKEAKDVSDIYGKQQILEGSLGNFQTWVNPQQGFEKELQTLRQHGVRIMGTIEDLLNELRDLAGKALKVGEDELAEEILQLILAEKLRRKPLE